MMTSVFRSRIYTGLPIRVWNQYYSKNQIFRNKVHYLSTVKDDETVWYVVSGLTKFSNRKDIEKLCLDLKPVRVECFINDEYQQTGEWAIRIPKKNKIVEIFNKMSNITYRKIVYDNDLYKFPIAYHKGITNRCICVRNVDKSVTSDQVLYLFEKYQLATTPVWTVKLHDYNEFLIEFTSSEEAERAALENTHLSIEGVSTSIHWFDI